jgi:hypothetical protein
MSYITLTYYAIKCDKCPAEQRSFFTDQERVAANATNLGWVIRDNIHLCPECSNRAAHNSKGGKHGYKG